MVYRGLVRGMLNMDDLLRVSGSGFDDVVRYCRDLYRRPLESEKGVNVSVTRNERENCTTDDGHKLPISYKTDLVYVLERKGADSVKSNETVADLCADPMEKETEPDNPGLRTFFSDVITEVNLQVLARLQRLLHLKGKGVVAKLTYSHTVGESVDVTGDLLAKLAGGSAIPSEVYELCDNFAVTPSRT